MKQYDVDLAGEAAWEPLEIPTSFGRGRSFVSGEPDGDRLRLKYYRPPERDRLIARVWFGPGAEGPPDHAHGGSSAAVLDEAMGTACWMTGHPVLAAQITIDFRGPVPLERVHTVEAWVERAEGRKIHTRGRLVSGDGAVFTEGAGLFVEIDEATMRAFQESGLARPGGDLFGSLVARPTT